MHLLRQLWLDEHASVVTAEVALITFIAVIGMTLGVTKVITTLRAFTHPTADSRPSQSRRETREPEVEIIRVRTAQPVVYDWENAPRLGPRRGAGAK